MRPRCLVAATLVSALGLAMGTAYADVPVSKDQAYAAGTLKIRVDATDVARRIFRIHETVPAVPGPLTLLYPQWTAGEHSPTGPLDKFAGLTIKANGKLLPWTRDPLNVYAFHLEVPPGADAVELEFQFLSSQGKDQGNVMMTPQMLDLRWVAMSLYPAGYRVNRIMTEASATYPSGWPSATALEVASRDGDTMHYKPISYEDLVDSPVYAGKYFKRIDLDPGAAAPVHLNLVADDPKYLEIKPEQIKAHQQLVQQMYKLYGAHHYDHYDFLLSLSGKLGGNILEHHRSSETALDADYFTDWDSGAIQRDLLPHEFNHSWNGKYRRGADLATPDFNVPMQNSLLWVYEGQTQFWGQVVTARSGMWSAEQFRDMLAYVASLYDKGRPGLMSSGLMSSGQASSGQASSGQASWRNVQDTTNDPIIALRRPQPYVSYQGSEEYYDAGELIWLDVDGKLRALSGNKHSLDDFSHVFFGMQNGKFDVNTYTFDDVVSALKQIAPYDWADYLRQRLDGHVSLLGGLEAHGWKLVYTDKPTSLLDAAYAHFGVA
ncbi:M61 family metallopeptidase, partial [Dyella silvatica]|uniref:M61 family metallopeptidase n=1 Tax=Dyella silvatica TaxID=2992128 RepID=UPI002257D477